MDTLLNFGSPAMHRTLLLAASLLAIAHAAIAASRSHAKAGAATLTQMAAFADQQITGISVAKDGRIFVNLPRWTVDVPVSVGEVKGGRIVAFPMRPGTPTATSTAPRTSPLSSSFASRAL